MPAHGERTKCKVTFGTVTINSHAALFDQFVHAGESIASAYESREYSRAVREIMALADKANQYVDEQKPWVIAKEEGKDAELHQVCSMGINLFRQLIGYLRPILPATAAASEAFLRVDPLAWNQLGTPLLRSEERFSRNAETGV